MPTTKTKNMVYRLMLPLFAPRCGLHPITSVSGHPLRFYHTAEKIFRKYHVLGSATILSSGNEQSLILTSSSRPHHQSYATTFFRVASITKLATAVLTLHLAENRFVRIDDPVSRFFPAHKLPALFDSITLRHLLSHTSGIIDPPDLESALVRGIPFPELISHQSHIQPGISFHYSNLAYGLIGCVLESVFQEPVSGIFNEHLFSPLQMNATLEGCRLDQQKIMPVTRIFPYHHGQDLILTQLGQKPLSCTDPLRHYGHTAGSMYADIDSVYRLLKVLSDENSTFLKNTTVDEIKKQHASYGTLSPTLSYGLGLLRINDSSLSDHMIYGHQGFAYGCADGAFWEESTGRIMITLNGGCSESRNGRLGTANRDFLRYAFRKELPSW